MKLATTLSAVGKILIILRMSSLLLGPVFKLSNCLNDKEIADRVAVSGCCRRVERYLVSEIRESCGC